MIPFPELRTITYNNTEFIIFPILMNCEEYSKYVVHCLGYGTVHRYGQHIPQLQRLLSHAHYQNVVMEVLVDGEAKPRYYKHLYNGNYATSVTTNVWVENRRVWLRCPLPGRVELEPGMLRQSKINKLLNS